VKKELLTDFLKTCYKSQGKNKRKNSSQIKNYYFTKRALFKRIAILNKFRYKKIINLQHLATLLRYKKGCKHEK